MLEPITFSCITAAILTSRQWAHCIYKYIEKKLKP